MKLKNYMNSIKFANQVRKDVLYLSHISGAAHLGSCLSSADIISVIFSKFINKKSKDRFVLSKGHAAMALYSALKINKTISKNYFYLTQRNILLWKNIHHLSVLE